MNTQRFINLVSEGYTLELVGTKKVIEGDKEKPVEQELVEAYLVSPFKVNDMMQNEDKNVPNARREMDGTPKQTVVRVAVPHVLYAKLDAAGMLNGVHKYEPEQKAA